MTSPLDASTSTTRSVERPCHTAWRVDVVQVDRGGHLLL
ncbi:hypothetical protein FHR75_004283 [Kineococcus radiotolerans]|uniref:Uncharacterized protein n=1 Tax=Kineococcus radiotolerans TaxID=131568 RepID=A0A7W4TQV2_KINRA|nr:hypothetical protein [Kineococcus radiotolerans]